MDSTPPRILGIKNRYWILFFIIASVLVFFKPFGFGLGLSAFSPHVTLPAENLWFIFKIPFIQQDFYFTNTIFATLIADVLLILIALQVRSAAKSGSLVPKGFSGAVEAFVEVLYNLTEGTAGKWAKAIIPWFAGITMLVLLVNWMELVPGVDSIGLYQPEHVHVEEMVSSDEAVEHTEEGEHVGDEGFAAAGCTASSFLGMVSVGGAAECTAAVVPFVRVASTDLNFTVAIAIVSVVMTQVIGVKALGFGYFQKFWYTKTLFSKPIFGVIDFAVGMLEIVSEISKVLSFSFRLFGNIFAGSVLLFVIGSLVPVFAQSIFLMLEFFVGLIQAVVFGMLTMVFMSQATQSHHDDGEEHH